MDRNGLSTSIRNIFEHCLNFWKMKIIFEKKIMKNELKMKPNEEES